MQDYYFQIGTDCGEFEDVIRSYHRLIDLREKWIDTEVRTETCLLVVLLRLWLVYGVVASVQRQNF